jgi:hypothetical protein
MRLSVVLSLALSAIVASASPETATGSSPAVVDPVALEARVTSLDKRALCVLGLCLGGTTTNYQTDVNNCGQANKRCSTTWANGSGSQCVSGLCFPGACNAGFALNSLTGQCQNVYTDVANWCVSCSLSFFDYSMLTDFLLLRSGSVGNVCAVTGATGNTCIAGNCFATTCGTGYVYSAGVCTVKIDTLTDVRSLLLLSALSY